VPVTGLPESVFSPVPVQPGTRSGRDVSTDQRNTTALVLALAASLGSTRNWCTSGPSGRRIPGPGADGRGCSAGHLRRALETDRETVDYVSNIYNYYLAQRLLQQRREAREQARPSHVQ